MVKNPPANAGDTGDTGSIPGSGRSSGVGRQPTPLLLAGNFHGQRSLAGYHAWGCKESDMTEHALTNSFGYVGFYFFSFYVI